MQSQERLRQLAPDFTVAQIRDMTDFIVRVRDNVTKGQVVADTLWREAQALVNRLEGTTAVASNDGSIQTMEHTPTPYSVCGPTIYKLNAEGTNRFYAQVQPGFCGGVRTSDAECKATAAFIARACNAHDTLVRILKEIADAREPLRDIEAHRFRAIAGAVLRDTPI